MVLYLDRSSTPADREGVYMCLREDQESVLQEDQRNRVKAALFDEFGDIKAFTTTIGRRVSRGTREQELEALWSKLQSAEAVVTDRLHGMIFVR